MCRILRTRLSLRVRELAVSLALAMLFAGLAPAAPIKSLLPAVDDETLLLLRVNPAGTALVDVSGETPVNLAGGVIEADADFGHVVRFDDQPGCVISVKPGDRWDFKSGFTWEAWLKVSKARVGSEGSLCEKQGSFSFRLGKQLTLDNRQMVFPRLPVVTVAKSQIGHFPVGDETFGGATSLPSDQWVHVAVSYEPDRAAIRTWIDGSEDRVRYLTRTEYGSTLQVDPTTPLRLFEGLTNVKVAGVRISKIARPIGPANLLEAYVHQLPYQNRIVLQFTHLSSDLPYPLQTSVTWEAPGGASTVIYRGTLTGPESKLVDLEPKGWNNDYYNIHVRVTARHKQVYSRMIRVANARVTADKRILVRPDKRISVNGKTLFPLVMYHVQVEDFPQVAGLGFHYITPRAPRSPFLDFGRKTSEEFANMQTALDAAKQAGVQLILPARISNLDPVFRFKDHPAVGGWAVYDEPWGVSLDKMVDSFNAIKMLNQEIPILCPQNNLTRMSETSEGVDILACDPYPIPRVSLRMVADATRAARRAVADLKPVWTLIDQYQASDDDKRPTLEELRCMLYLSIAAGADGIGIYAWDYRREDAEGRKRWCTKNSPADLEILATAIRELLAIENVLILPNDDSQVAFSRKNPAVHVAVKKSGKQTYLVIANDSRGTEEATVELKGVGDAIATNLADKAKLPIVAGRLNLALPPLAAGAYRVD